MRRRRFLKVAGGSAIAFASAIALVRRSGYGAPGVTLGAAELAIVQHLARRICAADAPDVTSPDAVDVAGFVDRYVGQMSPKMARELRRFLVFIEQLAPITLGLASRFTRLSPKDQDRVLASLEANANGLLRGGFAGVKALLFMGYYRDARTWGVLEYDGPWVKN